MTPLGWIAEYLADKINKRFTGKVEINFNKGGISKVVVLEAIDVPKEAVEV